MSHNVTTLVGERATELSGTRASDRANMWRRKLAHKLTSRWMLAIAAFLAVLWIVAGKVQVEQTVLGQVSPVRPGTKTSPISPSDLITFQEGTLGIVISAPHGGVVRVPGSKDRVTGTMVRDTNTAQLALLISQRVTERLGGKPHIVIAHFSRKDADANRDASAVPNEAYENDASKKQYDAYHEALNLSVDLVRHQHGRGIVIDVHGQARVPGAIVRGTRNGRAVRALVARCGDAALRGDKSVFGQLASKGYTVIPEPNDPQGKELFFDGGFITERYGGIHPQGIDAIQMEFGRMRIESLEKTARDTGDAIAEFYLEYYSKNKDSVKPTQGVEVEASDQESTSKAP